MTMDNIESGSDDTITSADGFELEEDDYNISPSPNISSEEILVPRAAVPVPVPRIGRSVSSSHQHHTPPRSEHLFESPEYEVMAETEISRLQRELHSAYTEVLELTHRLRDIEEENDSLVKKYRNAQVAVGTETEKWQRERVELMRRVKRLEDENISKTRKLHQAEDANRRKVVAREVGIQTKSEYWLPQQHIPPKGTSTQTDECVCVVDHKGVQTINKKVTATFTQTASNWDSELRHLESQLATHVNSSLSMKQKLVDLHGDSAQLIYMQDNIRELATLFGREQDEYNVILEDMKKASMEYKSYKPFIDDSRAFYSDYFDELETELRLAEHPEDDTTSNTSLEPESDWGNCKKMLMSLISSHATLRLEKRLKPVILPSDSFNRHIASALSSLTRSVKRLTLFKTAFNRARNTTTGYNTIDSTEIEHVIRFLSQAQKVLGDICCEMPGDERRSVGACSPSSSPRHVNNVPIRSKSHTRYPLRDLSTNRLGLSPVSSSMSSNSGTPTLQNFKKPSARPVPPPSFHEPSQLYLKQPGKSLVTPSKSNGVPLGSGSLTSSIWCD